MVSHSVRLQTRKKDTYPSSHVAEGLHHAVPSSQPSLSLDHGWALEGEDGHPCQQGGLLLGHGKVRPLDGSWQGGSRAMTMRQHTVWVQVCHGAMVGWLRGEVSCVLLGKEEKRKTCHKVMRLALGHKLGSPNSEQSDLITITKYGTFEPRI